jgi:site-specific DNA recombinase
LAKLPSNECSQTEHHDEWFDGSFAPIISPKLFESVQKVLATRERPRKTKTGHNFPFVGLFRCGECGSMFTAQWAAGKCGGKYRYYRCTKKKGKCGQRYLREESLVAEIKERLQTISLCDEDIDYMLKRVEEFEHEENHSSQSRVQNLSSKLKASEEKLDKLVSVYLDGDILKSVYIKKKDELLRESLAFKEKRKDFEHSGNNWVEPLREWILDTKQANFLSSSADLHEISSFVKKVGTNPTVRDKSARFGAPVPSEFVAERRALGKVLNCDPTGS